MENAHDHKAENQEKFKVFLERYPIVIPPEIIEHITDLEKRNNAAASPEEQQLITKEMEGHGQAKYFRLYQLRNNPNSAPEEIYKLEEELSDCFCGSGKKFSECHGV